MNIPFCAVLEDSIVGLVGRHPTIRIGVQLRPVKHVRTNVSKHSRQQAPSHKGATSKTRTTCATSWRHQEALGPTILQEAFAGTCPATYLRWTFVNDCMRRRDSTQPQVTSHSHKQKLRTNKGFDINGLGYALQVAVQF